MRTYKPTGNTVTYILSCGHESRLWRSLRGNTCLCPHMHGDDFSPIMVRMFVIEVIDDSRKGSDELDSRRGNTGSKRGSKHTSNTVSAARK